ncbi:hypothetical protein AB0G29_25655 [Streptomyces parvus]|uniref:hypothetical protein n=1 Tax=Streptomyces parvus TaxID=66428 RepID=UPI0033F364FF
MTELMVMPLLKAGAMPAPGEMSPSTVATRRGGDVGAGKTVSPNPVAVVRSPPVTTWVGG